MQIDLEQESQSLQADNIILPLEYIKLIIEDYETQELIIQDKKNQIYAKSINGQSVLYFKNGDTYQGDIFKGIMHGKGVFKWENGAKYIGTFVYNEIQGEGEYFWPDGSYYKGQVMHGKRHGHGYYETEGKKTVYEGEWFAGKRQGKGKIVFSSGASYEGEFFNGIKHGKGIFKYTSGNYYEGEYVNDKKEGYGVMYWLDTSEKYFGNWSNNLQNGFGVHIWLENKGEKKMFRNRYEGQWLDGERHGYGVFYYANGSKYEGQWAKNLKEGFAIFTEDNGNVIQGTFKGDKLIQNILDKPLLSLNLDDLDKTDLNNSISQTLSPQTMTNSKKNTKNIKEGSPLPKKSILGTFLSKPLIQQKSSSVLQASSASINNIPQDNQKLSSTFKPANQLNEANKEEKQNQNNNAANKSILGTEGASNLPTKRSNENNKDQIKDQQQDTKKTTKKDQKKDQQKEDEQKQLQENPYNTLLDYSDLDINFQDAQAAHKNLNTVLLRHNSNFIQWYKECSQRYESTLGEKSFTMDMQQIWKFLKEIKIFGGCVTQSSINRLFHRGRKNYYSIQANENELLTELEAIKALGRYITEDERKDLKLVEFLQAYKKRIKYEKLLTGNIYEQDPNQETEEIYYTKVINIHGMSQPILYRHFVDILVRVAFLRSKIPDQLHLELEKIIEQHIKPFFENKKKNMKNSSKLNEDELQSYFNKSKLIKHGCMDNLHQIFDKIKTVNRSSKFGYSDETCLLQGLIKVLKSCDIIKNEADQNFLYFILEQGFDPSLTLGQIDQMIKDREKEREKEQQKVSNKRAQVKASNQRKKTPDFKKMKEEKINILINTELIFSEFIKLILVYTIKNIKDLHPKIDDDVLEKKVCQMIEKINKKTVNYNDPRLIQTQKKKIWPTSIKDEQKVELAKNRLKKEELEKEKKRKDEEKKREQREKAQMELNDFNAPSDVEIDSDDDY
ncbi:hypothetical protein ABPG72_006186 [Tetrahymena utriculariae]